MIENKIKYSMSEVSSSKNTPTNFDYFFLSVDCDEERSWKILYELERKSAVIENLCVISFDVSRNDVDKLLLASNSKYNNLSYIIGEKQDYTRNVLSIVEVIKKIRKNSVVGLDITGMPTPQFFLLIKWLSRYVEKIYVYYTQPERYIMNGGLFKSYFSTVGPVSVSEINGFSGEIANEGNGNRVLICMLGFDNDLLPVVIQDAGPQKIVAINGFPSFFPKFKDISLANNQKFLAGSEFSSRIEKTKSLSDYFYVEALNPFETYNTLEEIADEQNEFCVDIVPLGTKPMALGACLFAIVHKDVRAVFPIPEKYAKRISQKSRKTYEYIIPLVV